MFIPDKNIEVTVFWDKMMCSLQIHTNISEEPTESFTVEKDSYLKMETVGFSNTITPIYQTTQQHIPDA
jgi:hypothetical protein